MPTVPAFTPVLPVIAQPVQRTAVQQAAVQEAVAPAKRGRKTAAEKGKATVAPNKKALAKAAAKFSDNKIEPPSIGKELATAMSSLQTGKADRKPRKPRAAKTAPAKRQRTMRIAPMQMDASTALTAMLDLSRKDLAAMAKMVELLNPLSRPARIKMLAALQKVANQ
jgi:chemotaxis protein histidine kinase CheA